MYTYITLERTPHPLVTTCDTQYRSSLLNGSIQPHGQQASANPTRWSSVRPVRQARRCCNIRPRHIALKTAKERDVKNVKVCIALYRKPVSELRDVTCHTGSHSVTCRGTDKKPLRQNPPRAIKLRSK